LSFLRHASHRGGGTADPTTQATFLSLSWLRWPAFSSVSYAQILPSSSSSLVVVLAVVATLLNLSKAFARRINFAATPTSTASCVVGDTPGGEDAGVALTGVAGEGGVGGTRIRLVGFGLLVKRRCMTTMATSKLKKKRKQLHTTPCGQCRPQRHQLLLALPPLAAAAAALSWGGGSQTLHRTTTPPLLLCASAVRRAKKEEEAKAKKEGM